MNPAILNYLQSQQGQPQGEVQTSPMQQNQGQQAPYNPFDSGIRSAIESAKQSLGMTDKQQSKAFRQSMLAFAANNAQQPKQRGFFNNFGSIARSLGPAVEAHDQAEDEALTQNNAMANQILAYKAAEEKKIADAEYNDWYKKHAEAQLGEQKRSHNLLDRFRRDSLESKNQSKGVEENSLDKVLDQAESLINKSDTSTHRGYGKRILNKFVPGGEIPLTKEQAEINAMGDVLRGQLFNKWGYRNQAEFEHVPSISADNPKQVNLAIIKQLKGLLSNSEQTSEQEISSESILMRDPETGEQEPISANRLQEALDDGLIIVE